MLAGLAGQHLLSLMKSVSVYNVRNLRFTIDAHAAVHLNYLFRVILSR